MAAGRSDGKGHVGGFRREFRGVRGYVGTRSPNDGKGTVGTFPFQNEGDPATNTWSGDTGRTAGGIARRDYGNYDTRHQEHPGASETPRPLAGSRPRADNLYPARCLGRTGSQHRANQAYHSTIKTSWDWRVERRC